MHLYASDYKWIFITFNFYATWSSVDIVYKWYLDVDYTYWAKGGYLFKLLLYSPIWNSDWQLPQASEITAS